MEPCDVCSHPRRNYRKTLSITTLAALSDRADAGCVPCSVLKGAIRGYYEGKGHMDAITNIDLGLDLNASKEKDRSIGLRILSITKSIPWEPGSPKKRTGHRTNWLEPPLRLELFSAKATPWLSKTLPDLPVGNELPVSTSSEESLAWAVQQIQVCIDSHVACKPSSEPCLPRRALDLDADCRSGVRLHESSAQRGRYVCLSHCWGKRPFFRTLSSTLNSHLDNIDFASLPLTFQEAIDITRRLAIRYLWIDSLCIIQDDMDDWRAEAAKMASIFQNCYLVVSAAKGSNAYDGLYGNFPSRCKTYTANISGEQFEDDSKTEETISIRQTLTHLTRAVSAYGEGQQTPLPVVTRGWIFQERILAPRVLHFGPEELSWECREATCCQCIPFPKPGWAHFSKRDFVHEPPPRTGIPNTPSQPRQHSPALAQSAARSADLEKSWYRVVEDYTQLHLTHEKDIFPALAGLANVVQSRTNWTYLGGLWRETLPRGLLWHTRTPTPGSSTKSWPNRPRSWRAPTWSWASVDYPVGFNTPNSLENACEVLEANCIPAGPDPTGELAPDGAYLVLRGTAIPAVIRLADRKGDPHKAPNAYEIAELDILRGYMKTFWVDDEWKFILPLESGLDSQRAVLCLLVARHPVALTLMFLVVAPVQEEPWLPQVGVGQFAAGDSVPYRRVGVVEVAGGPAGLPRNAWQSKLLDLGEERVVRLV
ncbi:heterokaryon incompatibility protein-domain-containing protein [Coniochaeta sp. 2T2.1]|nr:heterokaryon incompatibility protein-domain-containing protein [Coniochaeta sp. 2T2.1]